MSTIVPRTWVPGTPRGWGHKKLEREWLGEIALVLEPYRGVGKSVDPNVVRYEVSLEFRVFPRSHKYGGQNLPHGTDLDNLIKNTIDCLTSVREGALVILRDDNAVYRIDASKKLVENDDATGVWIEIRSI